MGKRVSTVESANRAGPTLGHRELRAVALGNEYGIEVEADHFAWTLDEAGEKGGSDSGPTPVQAFLGALLSCFSISFQFAARRKGVPIDRIEGWIVANDEKFIEAVALELQVWSAAPEADVRDLLAHAERGCFVRNALRPDIELTIDLIVSGSRSA